MDTVRGSRRIRVAGVAALVLLLAAVGGITAAVQYGANALGVGGGFIVSSRWSAAPRWAGIELENRTDLPITLRGLTVRRAVDAQALDVRVTDPRGSHILMSSEPLDADSQRAVDTAKPIDGFVLPPRSRDQYQVVVRFRPTGTGRSELSRVAIVYSVLGLDHGAVSDGVYRVRARGAADD